MELAFVIISALAGLLGAGLGAWLTKRGERDIQREERISRANFEDEQTKKQLTRALFLEWDNINNLSARISADNTLASSDRTLQELYKSIPESEWIAISRVMHFMEMLGDLAHNDQLDKHLYTALFGTDVRYWVPLLLKRVKDHELKTDPEIQSTRDKIGKALIGLDI